MTEARGVLKRRWIRLAAALAIVLLAASLARGHHVVAFFNQHVLGIAPVPANALFVGRPLPTLDLIGVDGTAARLAAKPGRVLYINVFATWCPDCIREMPALETFSGFAKAHDADIVGVDKQENASAVIDFARQRGVTYPVYIDSDHVTDGLLNVHFIPTTIIVGPDGIVRAKIAGALSLPGMRQALSAANGHQ